MREILSKEIEDAVAKMCIMANCQINPDIENALKLGQATEKSETAKNVFSDLIKNAEIAREKNVPICQDTGMAVFFVEVGNEVIVSDDTITNAINCGVSAGYVSGYLRKSVVSDPFNRINTKDNTPAVIYYDYSIGDKIKITFAPKGFGSENKSAIKMLNPSDGVDGAIDFIVSTVKAAGANPCPPMVVGVGIGGTMDKAAVLSKKALTRDISKRNENPFYADLEKTVLEKINKLNIGPQGLGGMTTAMAVNIMEYPTHIAGLPVAVNISCHATRHQFAEI